MSGEISSNQFEVIYFRKAIALLQAFYYTSLFHKFEEYFGVHGWVKNSLRFDFFSMLFWNDSMTWRWFLMAVLFYLLFLFWKGTLNRFGLVIYYLINLSFYLWNPMIVHEPQPLLNLFFLSFFILPMNFNEKKEADPWIVHALIVYLGVYYFSAGVKKLPDPNFLNGSALASIISWPIMAKNLALNLWFVHSFGVVLKAINYLTLLFEMGFLFLVYTRARPYLIVFGIFLHTMIYLTLEVGNFSFVMLAWYILLLDGKTRAKFGQWLSHLKIAPKNM